MQSRKETLSRYVSGLMSNSPCGSVFWYSTNNLAVSASDDNEKMIFLLITVSCLLIPDFPIHDGRCYFCRHAGVAEWQTLRT